MLEQKEIVTNITNLGKFKVDRIRTMQVFINLIKNAVNYSYPNSKINIYYKSTTEKINDTLGNWHEIRFVNEGIGIPHREKDSVFQLYHRASNAKMLRPTGRGIGLFLIQKIMRAHGGDCIIRSLNKPTTISVLFKAE